MNVECPNCGCEEAYHNNVCYECPECGYRWNDDDEDDDEPLYERPNRFFRN